MSKIEGVEISISALARPLLIHPRPENELEAKFSLEYCVSRAILDGKMGIKQFTPKKIHDPALRTLIEKVTPHYYEIPESQKHQTWTDFPADIRIQMKDGTLYSSRQDSLKGSLENPLSKEELEEKFRQCSSVILPENRVSELLVCLRSFEKLPDLADLAALTS